MVLCSAGFRFDQLAGGATDFVTRYAGRTLRGEPQNVLEKLKKRNGQGSSEECTLARALMMAG